MCNCFANETLAWWLGIFCFLLYEIENYTNKMQDIASDGCFSLGMVARFEPVLREKGAWMYPRLFWETGVIGQVLYLEAHAVGISATGIGCYFDDSGKSYLLYLYKKQK